VPIYVCLTVGAKVFVGPNDTDDGKIQFVVCLSIFVLFGYIYSVSGINCVRLFL
jgi:hypothetical protein